VSRQAHEGFIQGSEAYLAGVWYVMKDAQASYEKNRKRIEQGRQSPWAFLNKIRRAFGYEARQVPYSVMRAELQEFAETFGVDGRHPSAPISTTNLNAMKEFSQ
jgi:hypothetical protein